MDVLLYSLALIGLIFKILEKVVAIRDTADGGSLTLKLYLTENRYRLALSVVGTLVLLVFLQELGQLNEASALGAGYFGESAARFLTQRFKFG